MGGLAPGHPSAWAFGLSHLFFAEHISWLFCGVFLFGWVFFCNARGQTQGLMHPRQTLYIPSFLAVICVNVTGEADPGLCLPPHQNQNEPSRGPRTWLDSYLPVSWGHAYRWRPRGQIHPCRLCVSRLPQHSFAGGILNCLFLKQQWRPKNNVPPRLWSLSQQPQEPGPKYGGLREPCVLLLAGESAVTLGDVLTDSSSLPTSPPSPAPQPAWFFCALDLSPLMK